VDKRLVVDHNLWPTPEGVYIRLVVVRGCGEGKERLRAEGLDLVLYSCEEVPLRDNASAYRFFRGIGIDLELIYGETSRVKIFRSKGNYEDVLQKLLAVVEPEEGAPSWAKS
jgi:hypothetical protein